MASNCLCRYTPRTLKHERTRSLGTNINWLIICYHKGTLASIIGLVKQRSFAWRSLDVTLKVNYHMIRRSLLNELTRNKMSNVRLDTTRNFNLYWNEVLSCHFHMAVSMKLQSNNTILLLLLFNSSSPVVDFRSWRKTSTATYS